MPSLDTTALEQEIIEHFEDLQDGDLNKDVVKKCVLLCKQLKLSPEQLAEEYEAFTFNQKLDTDEIDIKSLDKFEIHKLKQQQFTKFNAPISVGNKRKLERPTETSNTTTSDSINDKKSSIQPPHKKGKRKPIIPKAEDTKLCRDKAGQIVVDWNSELPSSIEEAKTVSSVNITFPYSEQSLTETNDNIRYMYDSLANRSKTFEDISQTIHNRIEFELLAENATTADMYDQKVTLVCTEQLEPFHLFLQTPVISTGRIGKETVAQEDSSSLFIESTHAGIPVRTKLNVERLRAYSVFPGQVLAIKGANPTSKLFRLNAIRAPSVLPAFPSKVNKGINIMSACGPFVLHKVSINLEPLELLLEQVRERKPDVLVLNGPFVDQRQVESNGGVIQHHGTDYTAEQWFRVQIDMIMESVQNLPTKVLILPSNTDIHHSYCVYPQPRYTLKHHELGKKLFFLNDPSTFTLNNEITIGSTSVDTLAHLASEEIVKRPPTNPNKPYDRISVLLEHILQQGSYYPLYPPSESVCIDSSLVQNMQMDKNAPNILIVPSDFLPFVKLIGETLCINPGRVSKGTGGTYSHIIVHPQNSKKPHTNTRVEVVNI